jgi:hypothetical protein
MPSNLLIGNHYFFNLALKYFYTLSRSSTAWKYIHFTMICVVVLYSLSVELGISLTFTPDEVDLIFYIVNSKYFVKNRINKATVIVQHNLKVSTL